MDALRPQAVCQIDQPRKQRAVPRVASQLPVEERRFGASEVPHVDPPCQKQLADRAKAEGSSDLVGDILMQEADTLEGRGEPSGVVVDQIFHRKHDAMRVGQAHEPPVLFRHLPLRSLPREPHGKVHLLRLQRLAFRHVGKHLQSRTQIFGRESCPDAENGKQALVPLQTLRESVQERREIRLALKGNLVGRDKLVCIKKQAPLTRERLANVIEALSHRLHRERVVNAQHCPTHLLWEGSGRRDRLRERLDRSGGAVHCRVLQQLSGNDHGGHRVTPPKKRGKGSALDWNAADPIHRRNQCGVVIRAHPRRGRDKVGFRGGVCGHPPRNPWQGRGCHDRHPVQRAKLPPILRILLVLRCKLPQLVELESVCVLVHVRQQPLALHRQ
mmetsp:Transcript_17663/g.42588  ORF Transcript_17663/g.42588 Transcript_17663/m.42588 type:complete len:386 (-) Transcript_17663:797-1954(-)